MAAEFYSPADRLIYKDNQFITQEPYRLAPYPNIHEGEDDLTPATGAGIPYTNAFTNAGGGGEGGGGTGGNAFGWGTAIDPVNLGYAGLGDDTREFLLKAHAQNIKQPNYPGGQQTEDINFLKNPLAWIKHKTGNLSSGQKKTGIVGLSSFLPFPMNLVVGASSFLPKGEGYKMAGLDARGKGLYDTLANEGMLFEGSTGLKTLTGKNFMASGYLEGQEELANKFFTKADGSMMSDQEIQDAIATEKARRSKSKTTSGFKWKQMKEAFNVLKQNKVHTEHAAKQELNEIKKRHAGGESYSDIGKDMYTGEGQAFEEKKSDTFTYTDPDTGEKKTGYSGGRKDGGRIGFFEGALADTAEGKAMSPGTSATGEFIGGNNEPEKKKKLNIVPIVDTKWSDLGYQYPTGVVGFDASTPLGKLKAKMNLKNYVLGEDIEPQIDYTKNIGDFNIAGTTDLENYNLGIDYNKGPFSIGATIDDQGNKYIGGKLSWKWGGEDGGLVSIL